MSANAAFRTVDPDGRPARLCGVVAVAVGLGAVALLAAPGIRRGLLVEGLGLAAFVAADALRTGDRRLPALGATVAGVLGVGIGLVLAATGATLVAFVGVLPGLVGVALLAVGLFPPRGDGSRALVTAGSGGVFVCALASGVFEEAPFATLVVVAAAAVVAWDAGEHAINVGEQLGRRAATRRVELFHLAAGGGVALLAAVATRAVLGVGGSDLPLSSFVLLVVAVLLFALTVHE